VGMGDLSIYLSNDLVLNNIWFSILEIQQEKGLGQTLCSLHCCNKTWKQLVKAFGSKEISICKLWFYVK
jgi:hypothetical protein